MPPGKTVQILHIHSVSFKRQFQLLLILSIGIYIYCLRCTSTMYMVHTYSILLYNYGLFWYPINQKGPYKKVCTRDTVDNSDILLIFITKWPCYPNVSNRSSYCNTHTGSNDKGTKIINDIWTKVTLDCRIRFYVSLLYNKTCLSNTKDDVIIRNVFHYTTNLQEIVSTTAFITILSKHNMSFLYFFFGFK